jgi:hypothetical protein
MIRAPFFAAIAAPTVVLIFGGAILIFVFILTCKAIGKDDADRKFIFSVIALLLGLFGGGGVGALVGGQSATSAANSAANSVKSQVKTVATAAAEGAANKAAATAAAEGAANKAATDTVKSVQPRRSP